MKKNNNMDNPYSFYALNKYERYRPLEDNTENLLAENSETDSYNNDDIMSIYAYREIIQEYYFSNGNTFLYREFGEDKLALLYEREQHDSENTAISIYNSDTIFTGILRSNEFTTIAYINANDFLFVDNVNHITSRIPMIKHITNNITDRYIQNHLTPLVVDNQFINTAQNKLLADNFRKTYMRYNMATNLIPAQRTLKNILQLVNRYIATGELNKTNLLTEYIHLQNFAEMCSGTTQKLADFVYNESSVDLRELCDFLQNRIVNIDKLINMYLSDELEKDNKSL